MVSRQKDSKADPLGLNSGFANPDPHFDEWKPSEEYVPKSGNMKDSRFLPENLCLGTARRTRQMADMTSRARAPPSSVVASESKPPIASKLDGNGSWTDWGVNVSGASRYLQDHEEEKAKKSEATIDKTSASKPVPLDIEGMNKVLAQRAKAASASATAVYANGTSPRADVFDIQASNVFDNQATTSDDAGPYQKKSSKADTIISVAQQMSKPEVADKEVGAILDNKALVPTLTRTVSGDHMVQSHIEDRRPSAVTLVNDEVGGDALEKRAKKEKISGQTTVGLEQVDTQQRDENMASWPHGKLLGVCKASQVITFCIVYFINSVSKNQQAPLLFQKELDKHNTQVPPKQLHSVIKAADAYQRLHKVHEVLFKQEFIGLSALNFDKSILLEVDEHTFSGHYDEVCSLFLRQWNHRQGQFQKIMAMQKEMGLKVDSQGDLMSKSGVEFEKLYRTITSTHSKLGYGRDNREGLRLGHGPGANIGDIDKSGLFSGLGRK